MEETNNKPERNVNRQKYLVEKMQASFDENPTEETKSKLARELDFLRQLENAERGEAKKRAREKSEFARQNLLSRAVQQVPQE